MLDPSIFSTEAGDELDTSAFYWTDDQPTVRLSIIDGLANQAVAIMTPAEAVKLGWTLLHQAASLGWVEDEQ